MRPDIKLGEKNKTLVKYLQELLNYHGYNCAIDNDFGLVTEKCVKDFQIGKSITATGTVDSATWDALELPLKNADKDPFTDGNIHTIRELIVAYAKQHLDQKPMEIGGDNRGFWVRLYTGGYEGSEWYWCAGFVNYILKKAYGKAMAKNPFTYTLSCDELAEQSKKLDRYYDNTCVVNAGDIFLQANPKNKNDYYHTGLVIKANAYWIETIEGNTNTDGSRNGNGVYKRMRKITPLIGFISLA